MHTAILTPLYLREHIGAVLRGIRLTQGRTLRDVSAEAQVSLGYLSEIERGHKEASSELLESICAALEVPLSRVLREVVERLELCESMASYDSDPAQLLDPYLDEHMTLSS